MRFYRQTAFARCDIISALRYGYSGARRCSPARYAWHCMLRCFAARMLLCLSSARGAVVARQGVVQLMSRSRPQH